jgi:hypothetical protein
LSGRRSSRAPEKTRRGWREPIAAGDPQDRWIEPLSVTLDNLLDRHADHVIATKLGQQLVKWPNAQRVDQLDVAAEA